MPTYIALLRGVNVSGKNLLNMNALSVAFEGNLVLFKVAFMIK